MSFEQQDLYDELLRSFAVDINNSSSVKTEPEIAEQQPQSKTAMMMQLRKAANHHLLHRRQYDDARLRQMAQQILEVVLR